MRIAEIGFEPILSFTFIPSLRSWLINVPSRLLLILHLLETIIQTISIILERLYQFVYPAIIKTPAGLEPARILYSRQNITSKQNHVYNHRRNHIETWSHFNIPQAFCCLHVYHSITAPVCQLNRNHWLGNPAVVKWKSLHFVRLVSFPDDEI